MTRDGLRAFVGELRERGVTLRFEAGRVLMKGGAKLTEAERYVLRAHRWRLVRILTEAPAGGEPEPRRKWRPSRETEEQRHDRLNRLRWEWGVGELQRQPLRNEFMEAPAKGFLSAGSYFGRP